ncbi:hypothetical protein ACWERY_16090 [Streptomyces sp. NPDC004082]
MITILAAVLALAAGWTIGICHKPLLLPPPGCRCEDDAVLLAHERARFEDLMAQLDLPADLDTPKDHP